MNKPWPEGTDVTLNRWYDPNAGHPPLPAIEIRVYQIPTTPTEQLVRQLQRVTEETIRHLRSSKKD